MSELITWAGRTLSGTDRFGVWAVTDLEGWWDSPDIKGDTQERPYADGDFDLPTYNQARLVTASGHVRTNGHGQQHEAMNSLTGPMSGRFMVAGHGQPQWADMKRNSAVKFTPITDAFAQWQVRLKAVDPCKYGESRTFTAEVGAPLEVFHRGNYPAVPQAIIRGDMPDGYTVTLDGWNYAVSVALVPGLPHRIDYSTGVLRVNGVIAQNSVGNTNLTTVPPGKSVGLGLYRTGATGTGTVDMTITDTYI